MSEEKVLEKRLNQIVKLLAFIVTKDDKTNKDKAVKLINIGLESDEIAEALGIEVSRVREIRSRHRPKRAKTSRKKKK